MTNSTEVRNSWPGLEPEWVPAFEWVEATTAGRIRSWRRQARWRPAFFFDVELPDGEVKALYLRCQREESLPWTRTLSVEREYRIMRVLQDEGVLVPHVYGFCPAPEGILMDAVAGRDRFDDRDPQPVRDSVLEHYIDALAKAHSIPPEKFTAIGLRRPEDAEEIGLMGFQVSEKWYRSVKPGPDPVNEFIVSWIHRNVPVGRSQVRWIHFDAGQFLHHEGAVTALMDVEFSCLGDPLADLGAMRMRDTAQPIGDLLHAYRHYQKITGEPVDRHVVNFHAVRFALLTALLSAGARADPEPGFDLAQWESWSVMSQILCLEIIAEEAGVELVDDPTPLARGASRRRPWLLSTERVLTDVLAELPEDDHLAFRLRIARDMALAGCNADALAGDVERRDLDEAAELVGRRPRDWQEADRLLEEFILQAGPDREAELVRALYRRLRRQQALLDPAMRDVRGFVVQRVDWAQLDQ
ncbi:phosphotransferase [Nocardia vaccinii]|uniref:phosphotransferase n=1 Tax=Nocardia vaccinii TaxID=1822 RepID=UPI000B0A2EDB|nr:phosphotransferase [Nocardia vaccinii]